MSEYLIGGIAVAVFLLFQFIVTVMLRRVVPTNEVHIIQSSHKTISYGRGSESGNVYYEWPSWMPFIGVMKTIMPVSVFKLELMRYDAYDKDRLPFEIDLVAFFRIDDFITASQRVSSLNELHDQLVFILKGAARTMLASYDIHQIMIERATFGNHFTQEVQEQLKNWGCSTVKNIELMDIRDYGGSKVVENIMAKTKSLIEMQSRTVVAKNMQDAQMAEISAQQEVEVQKQIAAQTVGLRNAEREAQVGIATQQASQQVKEQERITTEKSMAVNKVSQQTQAEIDKNVKITNAEAAKQTAILGSEAEKQMVILAAEGKLEENTRVAKGIELQGLARAEAEKALQLAPVQAQITLAKEIGENKNYQEYLVTIKQVEASQAVGMEQAKALEKANIKVIANTGDPISGVTKVMDLFSAKGGTQIGAMLEGLAQTEEGKGLLTKVFKGKNNGAGANA